MTIEADIDVDEDVVMHPVQDYTGTVVSMKDIARETRRVVIELDREMEFNAGQYLKFQIPGTGADRTYSIANGWIFSTLAVGDQVSLSGPYGRFVLRLGDERPAVLVAGGTGLAPIKSMIRHALENSAYDGHLTLYQGARTQEWLYDVEEFQRLEKEYPDRFAYRPCLSEESAEGFGSGLVTEVMEAENETLRGCAGYLCGPPPMVEAALKTLMGKRLFPRDIYREDFFNEGDKATGGVRSPLIKR